MVGLPGKTYAERDENLRTLGFLDYDKYLSSTLWREIISPECLRRQPTCLVCKSKSQVVHHKSYSLAVLSGTDRSDLVALCHKHHHLIEIREDGGKTSLVEANVRLERLAFGQPVIKVKVEKKAKKKTTKKKKSKKKQVKVQKQIECKRCGAKLARPENCDRCNQKKPDLSVWSPYSNPQLLLLSHCKKAIIPGIGA